MNFGFLRPNGNLLERFLKVVLPISSALKPAVAQAANGTHILVPEFDTDGFSRITGTCRSNVALTLNVYQGGGATKNWVDSVPVPATATEGGGVAFTIEIVSQKARIDVVNAGSTSTTFSFDACMRSI